MSTEIFELWLRYLPRVRHVLRTEGAAVLTGKILRRLKSTPLSVAAVPELLDPRQPLGPFAFPGVASPSVSIVIPVFNQLGFTLRCLASLCRQPTEVPFEVIVVDDGSTDDTIPRLSAIENLRLIPNAENRGFVRSCNGGATQALGDYLVFLNNDTQAQPGWLDALIGTFEQRPDAGLVGSRLIYPDGRQQEAGAILAADGSAWNYGHLDDPYKPQHSYLREVDYCSGAALAIPRALFERLGGFDEHFAPAYYEDADLAMRVRAAGYRVYYQPAARVVHFEGVSAGTDRGPVVSGMKRYQAINREKFLARWGAEIADWGVRGEDLERTKERWVCRRALVVDNYLPTPDKESGSLRLVNLFQILQGLGYKVTFGAANLEAPEPYVSGLQARGVEVLYRPYVRSLRRHLAEHGALYDLVILSRADAAAAVMPHVRRHCPKVRILYDTVDLHFLRERRLAELTGDRSVRRLAEQRRRQELGLIDAADATLVVSEAELRLLQAERPQARLHLVSNIHRIFGSATPFEQRRDILFIGAFAHPPNGDAVRWLAREILPLVRAELPDLHCHVIGADPPADIRALAGPGLTLHGYVPDVAPYFNGCRLSVAPLRYGAGVKGKVNQSLAHGLPVVVTSQAAEGMYLVDGESALIADEPAVFATAVCRLYRDPDLWGRLSAGGLAVMEAHFGFAAARRAIEEVVGG
jgi:O-antigen biosynthesis protein